MKMKTTLVVVVVVVVYIILCKPICCCRCSDLEYYASRGWNVSDPDQSSGECRVGLRIPCDIQLCPPVTTTIPPVTLPPVYTALLVLALISVLFIALSDIVVHCVFRRLSSQQTTYNTLPSNQKRVT